MKGIGLEHVLGIQILFLSGITLGYHSGNIDSASAPSAQNYVVIIACFVTLLLASQGVELACISICTAVKTKKIPRFKLKDKYKHSVYMMALSIALLVYYNHSILREDFLMLGVACTAVRYLQMKQRPATITYGEALACSFAEGFLFHVIPPGGEWLYVPSYHGLVAAIAEAEAARRVVFPLRRMLVVFPHSLYCPRNLDEFNKNDDTLPRLELCRSLPEIRRAVAGVVDRVYRNTVYKVRRHPADPRPVHVVCATPINTLWMVLQKRAVYTPMGNADAEEIADAFCATLPAIIRNSPELRGKCDLVYYNDKDPSANLAETLLAKIREIEPNFESITRNQ